MTIERKVFIGIETKVPDNAPAGTVDAYVSASLNEDLGGDIVIPGAFKKFSADVKSGTWPKWPTLLFNHGIELGLAAVTGKVVDMEELLPGDARLPERLSSKGLGGLWIRGQYNLKTFAGREAYEHRIAGDISDFSYMYEAPETAIDSKGRRLLKTIYPVYEISDVLIGMNPETFAVGVKSLLKSLAEEPAPDSKRAKLLAEVRDILEQVEGFSLDPANENRYELTDNHGSVKQFALKGDQLIMVGNESFHQGAYNMANQAITALIKQELSEDGYELDDVRWLAGIGSDLRSWAQNENWDAISDAQDAARDAVVNPPTASTDPGVPAATVPTGTSSGAPIGTTSLTADLSVIPATDDIPQLDAPQRILDPFTRSATHEVEVKVGETEDEIDEEKLVAFAKLAVRDLLPQIDLSEFVTVPAPLDVIEESGTRDGLTNWARQRTRQ
jgi:HK97 family phage prohead protease